MKAALPKITWEIRNTSGRNFDQGKTRELTLEIIGDLLASGKMESGWPTADGGWESWKLSQVAALTRIEAEWDALGKEPNIGSEIVWFTAQPTVKR